MARLPKLWRFESFKLIHYRYQDDDTSLWMFEFKLIPVIVRHEVQIFIGFMHTRMQAFRNFCIPVLRWCSILCLSKIWKSRTFLKSVEHLRLILFLTFNKSNLIQTWVHHISLNCVMVDSLICAIVNFFKLQPDFQKIKFKNFS